LLDTELSRTAGDQVSVELEPDAVKRPHDEDIDSRARGRRNPPRIAALVEAVAPRPSGRRALPASAGHR